MNPSTMPTTVWSGQTMLDAFKFAAALLDYHRDDINALNVFPVPDNDTGTNMSLTMQGALETASDIEPDSGASDIAAALAHGALTAAHGNSGMILSQFFQGFATGLGKAEVIDGRDLARALDGSQLAAYKAVIQPVEGTMLTVIRETAIAAGEASRASSNVLDVLDAALAGAQTSLETTPQLLDILRQAGVVDAGGQGIVHIIDGLARSARGDTHLDKTRNNSVDGVVDRMAFLDLVDDTHDGDVYGYCTNFMVFGKDIDPEVSRAEIAAMGNSAVIVGDETMLKVHVHTIDPGKVLHYAARLGELDQIRIDNMNKQAQQLSERRRARDRTHASPSTALGQETTGRHIHASIAIVAVASGAGIAAALRALGADFIIHGGHSMNPSTEELLNAVESLDANDIILLPNNRNIVMDANQVDALTGKTVRVVPTHSIPAALAALAAFNIDHDLDRNTNEMTRVIRNSVAFSVTRAIRSAEINGITIIEGQTIGLINDEVSTAGDNEANVVLRTIAGAGIANPELLTVFAGEHVAPVDQETLAAVLSDAWPHAEIEMHDGGQPHVRYIISIE